MAAATLCALPASLHAAPAAHAGKTRTYYVAADEVQWDYAPSGRDEAMGMPFDANAKGFVETSANHIGRVYKKAVYHEYTDATFTTIKPREAKDAYLGILGPILYAEVGDTIKVVFKNNATHPYGMHPHGVLYQKDSEGANYNGGSGDMEDRGACIAPGANPHLHLAGSRALRTGPQRSQFPLLALPLALRRAARRGLGPLRRPGHHAPRHGAA